MMNWILSNKEWLFSGAGLAVVTIIVAAIRFLAERRRLHRDGNVDEIDGLIDEIAFGPYKLQMADEDDIRWIALKAKELYGSDDSVPTEVKLSWFRKNPKGFWIIKNYIGERLGSCELIPLRRATIDRFINGEIRERDKTEEDILSTREMRGAECIYVENFMCVGKDNFPNHWAFKECIMSLPHMVSEMGLNASKVKLYAMPIKEFRTGKGKRISPSERLLKKVGFGKVSQASKQGYPVYCAGLADVLSHLSFISLDKRLDKEAASGVHD